MPSSMIFASLVVLWLLILVPAVARRRQEVARPSVAALSGRVLDRPWQRRELEVDPMDEVDQPRHVPTRPDREDGPRLPVARTEDWWRDDEPVPAAVPLTDDDRDEWDEDGDHDDRWERPPPRYRPGRGGFDPEVAALAARARYAFRQRVVLTMLILALGTGVIAAMAIPGLWWLHAAVDVVLVGYLVYLRRQVRLEDAIRERRAARMAGTRRQQAAEDPELDEWARRGREATHRPVEDGPDDRFDTAPDEYHGLDDDHADDLVRERPERVPGAGEPLRASSTRPVDPEGTVPDPGADEPALPRLQPAPPPPLPAGTALVESTEDDPELHELDGPARFDYRRVAGE
ncbi:MAG: divisome protein SepX/GlpR [Pseudonocardia sp.]